MKEEKAMRELHKIRAKHYEETRKMSNKKLADSINQEAKKARKYILEVRENRPPYGKK
jgi:predicted HTH transcriptional regulator